MKLTEVVPWGRNLNEYKAMFSLTERDLDKTILGCSDGPACFNAELTKRGGNIVSIDPVYQFTVKEIQSRIDDVYPIVMDQVSQNRGDFIWSRFKSLEALGKSRLDAMALFLNDYDEGKESGRYLNASLPSLPFEDESFELALCSHYLFLYSGHINREAHILSVRELCRVAKEVRIYPLLSIEDNKVSMHLEPVRSALSDYGVNTSLVPVDYEFQKGATEMLVARPVRE